jgi:hypothetical protein
MDNWIVLIIIIVLGVQIDKKIQNYYKEKGTDGDSVRIFVAGSLIFIFLVIKFFMITSKY